MDPRLPARITLFVRVTRDGRLPDRVYKNMELGVVCLAFRCNLTGEAARASEESLAVRWLSLVATF